MKSPAVSMGRGESGKGAAVGKEMGAGWRRHGGMVMLSVVIPARNEAGRIGPTFRAVHQVLSRSLVSHEIIVVDDGSSDATALEADVELTATSDCSGLLVTNHGTNGKGAAITLGMARSSGRFVAFIDADQEYPPDAIPDMIRLALEDTTDRTCVIAERTGDERSLGERISSHGIRFITRSILHNGVRDTQAGLKLFPGWFAREALIKTTEKGWIFDVEALLLAKRYALTVRGYPVTQRSLRPRRARVADIVGAALRLLRLLVVHYTKKSPRTLSVHPSGRKG